MDDHLGMKIIKCRREKKLSQAKLSDMTGIGRDRLSKIEQGVIQQLNDSELDMLANAFGVDKNYFTTPEEKQEGQEEPAQQDLQITVPTPAKTPSKKAESEKVKAAEITNLKNQVAEQRFLIQQLVDEKKRLKELIVKIAIKQLTNGDTSLAKLIEEE